MNIRLKKIHNNAVIPTKAHASDAGFDLTATSRTIDEQGNIVYGTGLAFEIPEGYAGFIFPRSSISKKDLALTNAVGIVDCHYRGEVMAKFKIAVRAWASNKRNADIQFRPDYGNPKYEVYEVGERIAQLVILPYPEVSFEQSDELSATDRGTGGYGSTGK